MTHCSWFHQTSLCSCWHRRRSTVLGYRGLCCDI